MESPRAHELTPVTAGVRVTAVVLNYGREELTAACVASLVESRGVALRILIVDNASPDGSGERLRARFPEHDFLQTGENLGYAGGNALGIDRAIAGGAAYVLVLNDDVTVANDAVARLVSALESDAHAAAAGPTIVFDDAAATTCWAGGEFDIVRALGRPSPHRPTKDDAIGVEAKVQPCGFVSGCCVLLRASVARELGSFRAEYFAYVEDAELSLRWARAGWRLLHVPAARAVHHTPWPEPTPAAWKIRLRDLNRRRLVREHYGVRDRVRFVLWFYPSRVGLLIWYLVRGEGGRAKAIWDGGRSEV